MDILKDICNNRDAQLIMQIHGSGFLMTKANLQLRVAIVS